MTNKTQFSRDKYNLGMRHNGDIEGVENAIKYSGDLININL